MVIYFDMVPSARSNIKMDLYRLWILMMRKNNTKPLMSVFFIPWPDRKAHPNQDPFSGKHHIFFHILSSHGKLHSQVTLIIRKSTRVYAKYTLTLVHNSLQKSWKAHVYIKVAPQPPTNGAPNEPARPICAQEIIFWAKNPNFYRWKQKFW